MSEKLLKSSNYLIKVIRDVLNDKSTEPIEGDIFTYKDIISLAKFHQVENIVYFGIEKFIKDPNLLNYIKKREKQNITQVLYQEEEKKILCEAFEKSNIDFLPVKGYFNRSLYPRPDFRFMSDLDILFDKSKKSSSKKMMKKIGYKVEEYNYRNHDVYSKEPLIHVELHRSLLPSDYQNYQYYEKIYEKATISKDNKNLYILNEDDRYLFDLVHLKKHYDRGGIGIRNFIDIYLNLTKNASKLHEDYLKQESEKLGITEFRSKIEKIAIEWFGTGEESEELKEMKEFIITSGVYGTVSNLVDGNLEKEKSSKTKTVLKRAFPSVKEMRGLYPVLEKSILLLPFCYICRLCRALKKSKRVIGEIKEIKNK